MVWVGNGIEGSDELLREAAEYYARNANSYEFEWLIPAVTVLATFFLLTRAWCRRGADDAAMLVIGAAMGLAVQVWLDPCERALASCTPDARQKLLEIVGQVHVGQFFGSLAIVGLHWRAVRAQANPHKTVMDSKLELQMQKNQVVKSAILARYIRDIVEKYDLHAAESYANLGLLNWKQRMGIHKAYHSEPANWIGTHVTGTTTTVVLLFALSFVAGGLPGIAVVALPNLALYAACDVWAAASISLLYALLAWPASSLGAAAMGSTSAIWVLACCFLALLPFQVCVGHWWLEDGIDDSSINFAELLGGDPRPFLLLPFYTYLDMMFLAGYDSATYTLVQEVCKELRPKLVAENNQCNAKARMEPEKVADVDQKSTHPGFEREEFILGGAVLNFVLLFAEVCYASSAATPTWIARFLVGANAFGIINFAWNRGLRAPLEHLSTYGMCFQDERLARWCLWYLGCFGFCGVISAAVGPHRAPLGVLAMGVEKIGFVALFVKDLSHAVQDDEAPSARRAQRNLLIYDVSSCVTMLAYGIWLMTS